MRDLRPQQFTRTLRALDADGGRGRSLLVLAAAATLGGWLAWFTGSTVAVYETARGQLEVAAPPYAAVARSRGRVTTWNLELGRVVHEGDLLVELDARALELEEAEVAARIDSLEAQHRAIEAILAAEEAVGEQEWRAVRAALREAETRGREAHISARQSAEEERRFATLARSGALADLENLRAMATSARRRALAEASALSIRRIREEARSADRQRLAERERLQRELATVAGELGEQRVVLARVQHDLRNRRIVAPVGGTVAEVRPVAIGELLEEGQRVGAILPAGDLRVVAYFQTGPALGRIRPGQRAELRLDGFSWTEFGTVTAVVDAVAHEVDADRFRVELRVVDAGERIPLAHGLQGSLEVEVERASPSVLLLRRLGKVLE